MMHTHAVPVFRPGYRYIVVASSRDRLERPIFHFHTKEKSTGPRCGEVVRGNSGELSVYQALRIASSSTMHQSDRFVRAKCIRLKVDTRRNLLQLEGLCLDECIEM